MTIVSLWQRLGVVPMSPGLRETRWSLERERQTLDLTYVVSKRQGSPRRQESVRAAWPPAGTSESLRERAKTTQLLDRESAAFAMPNPGSHTPYLAERIRLGYLVPGPLSPLLICSWSLLGPCPEGRSHRPPDRQEGAGGGSLPGGVLKAIWGGSRTHCVC